MTTSTAPATAPGRVLAQRLSAVLRPEFTGDLIRIDPDNPVFARGRCQVTGCDRGAWTKLLCNTHYGRPAGHRPAAANGPARTQRRTRP